MTIVEFFTEVENLNQYAHLDPETLPIFLQPGLNHDLRLALVRHRPELNTYAEWKALAIDIGRDLEAYCPRKTSTRYTEKTTS